MNMRIRNAIAAICLLLVGSVGLAQANGPEEHGFVGARKCRSCHVKEAIGDQYTAWEGSGHAKAMETLASEKARKWAAERGIDDPTTADECVKCHTTAHGVPVERLSRKFKPEMGVQCEACHGAGKDYRKKKYMIDRDVAVSRGLVLQSEKVCVVCHNDESPAWDPERYTRKDGSKAGFDYEQAVRAIAHPVTEGYDPNAEGEAD